MNRVKPSFWLYLKNNFILGYFYTLFVFPAPLSVLIIILISGATFSSRFIPYWSIINFSVSALIIIAIGIKFLFEWKKFQKITLAFENGIEIFGKVVDIYFFLGQGYMRCEYEYQQRKYRFLESPLYSNQKTKKIRVGQEVALFIDPNNPERIVVRDLYLNTF